MKSQKLLSEVIDAQKKALTKRDLGIPRTCLFDFPIHKNFVNVITGIRRCGKSTLLLQLKEKYFKEALFLNFEDIRLTGFEPDDFRRLDEEIRRRDIRVLLFDEIQVLENWELYVRQKLDENFQVLVTGSNATLLSQELGSKLTGRHISNELFPFSYEEFLRFRNEDHQMDSALEYLKEGGFPEYLKTREPRILNQLLDDILYRDITVRYGIRDIASLRKLVIYLISNIGKPVSATSLLKSLEIKSASTILEYFSHLENAYILQFIPLFSHSLRKQIRNPKKVYAIDTGLYTHNTIKFSGDLGRRLENLVFLHLRRKNREIYYFQQERECDFIVIDRERPKWIIQVCYDLTEDNLDRELTGAFEALQFFEEKKGFLVTMSQTDRYEKEGRVVEVVPAHEFLRMES